MRGRGSVNSCSHEGLRASFLDEVTVLIEDSTMPGDDASSAVRVRLQRLDLRERVDRVPEDDRTMEFPFKDCEEGERVDARSLADQAGGDGQTEQAMGHRPAEGVVRARKNGRRAAD